MYTIAGILVVLWLLGLWMSWGGAWIHVLLVLAVILVLVKLFGNKGGGAATGGGTKMGDGGGQPGQPAS